MIEEPSKKRSTTYKTTNGLRIEIPSLNNIYFELFSILILCPWAFGLYFVIKLFLLPSLSFSNSFVLIFSIVWLTFWLFWGLSVIYYFLWERKGTEIIQVHKNTLAIESVIAGLSFLNRKKEYYLDSIANMEVVNQPDLGNNRFNFLDHQIPKIRFDYGTKTIRFAKEVEEGEARMLIKALKNAITESYADSDLA